VRPVIALVAGAALLIGACGKAASPGSEGVNEREVAIYAAVIREMAGTEEFYRQIFVYERPCPGAGDPERSSSDDCARPLSGEEQAAILERLKDLPPVEFVSDAKPIQDRIFNATEEGTEGDVLIRFGPAPDGENRVEVPASAYCGGLCGHWMTLVVQREDEGWKVTGTTGPVSIS
jgi:hypothetical protein